MSLRKIGGGEAVSGRHVDGLIRPASAPRRTPFACSARLQNIRSSALAPRRPGKSVPPELRIARTCLAPQPGGVAPPSGHYCNNGLQPPLSMAKKLARRGQPMLCAAVTRCETDQRHEADQ
ncbi:hypothetical protein roselon_01932 [Roseibacterium elongatum DSM 19469]|uniref:Uncharacterized protein n=1 Tax=Roseicyclus elongatus DSM 19469 TaxID=1294273 RepID=W8RSV5_9RHOB|nr:hypothetical protein roselon_01932 [Roseibacterium elongatum DSM 19469]